MADQEPELSGHLQDSIAFLAITSTPFLKLIRNFIKAELLPAEVSYHIVKACYRYYDIAKEAPQDHICDALNDVLKGVSAEKKELVFHFLDRVSQMRPPNQDYVVNKLNSFVKSREFETGAVEFVKLVDQKKFLDAELLMYNVLRTGVESINIGCNYFTDFSTLSSENQDPLVSMGLREFDCYQKFYREQLVVFLGGPKGKKSWCLTHLGMQGLLKGLNVLHISHENSLDEVVSRYDRMAGSLTGDQHRPGEPVDIRYIDDTGKIKIAREIRPSILDPAARREARKVLSRFSGRLICKKYPMYSATSNDIERYLDYLEKFENFIPDLLLSDYPDIMKPLSVERETRDTLNDIYMQHKKWADERHIIVATVSQAKREAIRAKRISMKDFASDIRKAMTADIVISICQSDTQAEVGIGTLFVAGARKGPMDVAGGFLSNLDVGQFATDSFKVKLGVTVAEDEPESDSAKRKDE